MLLSHSVMYEHYPLRSESDIVCLSETETRNCLRIAALALSYNEKRSYYGRAACEIMEFQAPLSEDRDTLFDIPICQNVERRAYCK